MAAKIDMMYVNKSIDDFNRGVLMWESLVHNILWHFGIPKNQFEKYKQPLIEHLRASMDEEGKLDTNAIETGVSIGWYTEPNTSTTNESMKQLQKKIIYNVSENNYAQANEALEKLIEQQVRERISKSLQQVDEGLFDRLGAKAAGLGAKVATQAQNFVTKAAAKPKAAVQAAAGAVTGKGFDAAANTLKSAETTVASNDPKKKAKAAQANSLVASFAKDLSTLYPGLNVAKVLQNLRTQLNFAKA